MYNDAADGGKRKMFYFAQSLPERRIRSLSLQRHATRARTMQLNVANALDSNRVLYLVNATTGALRYAQWFNAPRKYSLTTSWSY